MSTPNTEKNYKNVSALAPQDENFDHQAVNEGVWLTVAHLSNIEQSLEGQATIVSNMQGLIDTANTALDTANNTIATQNTEITNLKNEVAQLKLKPADEIEETVTTKPDDHGGNQSKWPSTSVDAEKAKIDKIRKG